MDRPPAPSHYFDVQPSVASSRGRVTLALSDISVDLETDRGVFSTARVDQGTRFLLATVPAPGAVVLDLGCGYGPIALTAALRRPDSAVWAVDVNDRALELCASNATAAGATNVTAARPEQVPPDVRFDTIWSNPPVRIGKIALHAVLAGWLDRLTSDGVAWLVVHRHLGSDSLAEWLAAQGHPTRRAASRQGYRVLEVGAREQPRTD